MLKMNLQFFSHHKGGGSTSNGRNSAGLWAASVPMANSLRQAISCIVSAVPRFTLAKTLVAAAMIPCSRLLTAL